MKHCPHCDGLVQDGAIKCKHCKQLMEKEKIANTVESEKDFENSINKTNILQKNTTKKIVIISIILIILSSLIIFWIKNSKNQSSAETNSTSNSTYTSLETKNTPSETISTTTSNTNTNTNTISSNQESPLLSLLSGLMETKNQETRLILQDVNLRSRSTSSSEKIHTIYKWDEVVVLWDTINSQWYLWYNVEHWWKEGWISYVGFEEKEEEILVENFPEDYYVNNSYNYENYNQQNNNALIEYQKANEELEREMQRRRKENEALLRSLEEKMTQQRVQNTQSQSSYREQCVKQREATKQQMINSQYQSMSESARLSGYGLSSSASSYVEWKMSTFISNYDIETTRICYWSDPCGNWEHSVNSYSRSDGTYVQGHCRSNPDGYEFNNNSYYR